VEEAWLAFTGPEARFLPLTCLPFVCLLEPLLLAM